MEFTITSSQLLGFCTLVIALWGVYKIFKEIVKPSNDLRKKVDRHDELLREENDKLKEVEASNKMILQSMFVIVNHEITGNGIEQMKKTRSDLEKFLVNK